MPITPKENYLMLMRGEMYDIGRAEFLHLAAPVLMTFMMACWMCKIRNGNKKQSGFSYSCRER